MSINKNSSRDQILKYIKEDSYGFLFRFSHKPWAQPYIDEAAKEAAKKTPYSFLCYLSNKPWAQPHINEAVKLVAKENPEYFIKKWADRFPQGINIALFSLGNENVTK